MTLSLRMCGGGALVESALRASGPCVWERDSEIRLEHEKGGAFSVSGAPPGKEHARDGASAASTRGGSRNQTCGEKRQWHLGTVIGIGHVLEGIAKYVGRQHTHTHTSFIDELNRGRQSWKLARGAARLAESCTWPDTKMAANAGARRSI